MGRSNWEKRPKAPDARQTNAEERERMCDYVTEPRRRITQQTGLSAASLASALRAAIAAVLTGAVFFIPLVIVPGLADSYTLPKVALLRLATGLVLVLWVARLAAERRIAWVKTPLDRPVAAFMLAAVLAAGASTDRALSFFGHYKRYEDVFTLVGYGLIYFAATNNLKREDGRRVVSACLAAAGLISVYAVCQYFGYDILLSSAPVGRATGTLGNAVFLGTFLALMLPIALGRLSEPLLPPKRLLYMLLTVVMAAGLVFTFSRGAWLGSAAGIAVLAGTVGRGVSRRYLVVGVLLVVLVFSAANIFKPSDVKSSSPVVDRAISSFDTDKGSVGTRLWLWRTTLGLIAKRPLFGYGPDTLVVVYPKYLPDAYKKLEPQARIDKAHNDLLNVGATLGLTGLAAFLALIFMFLRASWLRLGARVSGEGPPLVAGLIAYLAAVEFSFSQVEVAVFFWLVLAVAMLSLGLAEPTRPVGLDSPAGIAAQWLSVIGIAGVSLIILFIFSVRPIVADYHFQNGLRAETHGRFELARKEFASAAAVSRVRSLYYYRLGRRYQIDATDSKDSNPTLLRSALTAYANAEALDPMDANLYTALGSLYTYLSRRDARFTGLAARAFSLSLALNHYLPETYVDLGVFEAQRGRKSAAIENFKHALRLEPDNQTAKENFRALLSL
ncbi:MAG: O-antigen ligase family protein [Actinomycetota bacterium]|nr:O-antigen ligase family protein [Actinomycetota bacterium]